MKKWRLVAAFALAAVCVFTTACSGGATGGETEEGDASLSRILDNGKLVLGCDDSFPPMGFRDDSGEIVGFDIDLARAVAGKLGVELVVKPINWQTKEMELQNGNIDIIWNGYTITGARDLEVEFTKPYLGNEQCYVVRKDSDVRQAADLAGKVLGCQTESAAEEAVEADAALLASLAELRKYDSYQDAMLDLEVSDRIAAVAADRVLVEYVMSRNPDVYRILDQVLMPEYYGIGCPKGAVALREAIDTALDELYADGVAGEISNIWFGQDNILRHVDKLTQADLGDTETPSGEEGSDGAED